MEEPLDLLLEDGCVDDGTRAPRVDADVGLKPEHPRFSVS